MKLFILGVSAQYLNLLSNQKSIASPQLSTKRSQFIELMKQRVSSNIFGSSPKVSMEPSTPRLVSEPISTPTTTTAASSQGVARMMDDEVELDPIFQRELQRELDRQKMEQNRLEREKQRIEKENQRIEKEKQRVLADEQNLQRLREKEHELEEHIKSQQERLEEQRIQREQQVNIINRY